MSIFLWPPLCVCAQTYYFFVIRKLRNSLQPAYGSVVDFIFSMQDTLRPIPVPKPNKNTAKQTKSSLLDICKHLISFVNCRLLCGHLSLSSLWILRNVFDNIYPPPQTLPRVSPPSFPIHPTLCPDFPSRPINAAQIFKMLYFLLEEKSNHRS